MKRLLTILVAMMLAITCLFTAVGCDDDSSDSAKLGLLKKKYTGESFYTVYSYKDEGEKITSLEVKSDATHTIGRIATATFAGDSYLTNLVIDKTVTEIQTGALKGMKRIVSITLPFIGKNANADAYMFETAEQVGKSVDAERNLGYLFSSEEYEYGADIECNYGASTSCSFIPASLRKIVVNPASNYKLPMYAFGGINIITEVKLEEKVVAIGTHAFDGCRALTTVEISKDVANIYDEAFTGCEFLTAIKFNGTKEEWQEITKSKDWLKGSKLEKAICSDGDVNFLA